MFTSNFFDFNIGNLLTIVSYLTVGIVFALSMKSDINIQSQKMDLLHVQNTARLTAVELEIRTLREVLVETAQLRSLLDSHEKRLNEMFRRIYEDTKAQTQTINRG